MNVINLKPSLYKMSIITSFLIASCLFMFDDLFSWNRDYVKVAYLDRDTAIQIQFEFFDYGYGPFYENGYLEWCDYYYQTGDGKDHYFMVSETADQEHDNWSWVDMKYKLAGAKLQFLGCYDPPSGTMWPNDGSTQRLDVYNITYNTDKAYISIKWYLGSTYQNIKTIRILGRWYVNGAWPSEGIDEVYTVPKSSSLDSDNLNSNHSSIKANSNALVENKNKVKIYKEVDAVVIKGIDPGENIKVYTTSGAEIKPFATVNEVMKINLPANQIYIVQIGQTHHKIAM